MAASLKSRVQKAFDTDDVTVSKGTPRRVEVVKGDCRAKFDVYKDHVNWVSLQSPGFMKWARQCADVAQTLFPELGCGYVVADPRDPEARKKLDEVGDWHETVYNGRPRLRWDF